MDISNASGESAKSDGESLLSNASQEERDGKENLVRSYHHVDAATETTTTTTTTTTISSGSSASGRSDSKTAMRMTTQGNAKKPPQIIVKILSAEYGPCEEGRRLLTGERTANAQHSNMPYTRDVTPFLRALLSAQQERIIEQAGDNVPRTDADPRAEAGDEPVDNCEESTVIRVSGVTKSGMKRTQIPLMDQMKGMNAWFGDPCPGVSKRLHISYMVTAALEANPQQLGCRAEIHRVSFAEHEKVLLRHRRPPSSDTVDDEEEPLVSAAATAVFEANHQPASETNVEFRHGQSAQTLSPKQSPVSSKGLESVSGRWCLPTAVSEVVLPLVMEYLSIPERVHARLVCCGWRRIIRDFGVATVIDNNDPQLRGLTRPFLMGLLKHSYSSLQSLFLSGFVDLEKNDLHPSIPHLRKLRSLDVSRCIQLDDSTLSLLAEHCSETLEVLYIKSLRRVTDQGMLAICNTCAKLRVLEISNVPLTDLSGMAIGQKLTSLNALYMRDNFRLTNQSVTSITSNCRRLEQLTLWGCTRIQGLNFALACREKLFLLNLWGCHGLKDEIAVALESMDCLRTLIVTECHLLTDSFFVSASISKCQNACSLFFVT